MKYLYTLLFISLIILPGCTTSEIPTDPVATDEVDLQIPDGKTDPDDTDPPSMCDKNFSFANIIAGGVWEGYHDRGELRFPTRFYFDNVGNVKMETKPLDDEDWQEVQNFLVDRVMVHSDDELNDTSLTLDTGEIFDVVPFTKFIDMCDNLLVTNFILIPEGGKVDAESPFNFSVQYIHLSTKIAKTHNTKKR